MKQKNRRKIMANYLKVSAIKALVKESGRRSGKDFIEALDEVVKDIITRCLKVESKKKTLDTSVINKVVGEMTEDTNAE
jgi:hypothetical protein